jgi:hypothetical protein
MEKQMPRHNPRLGGSSVFALFSRYGIAVGIAIAIAVITWIQLAEDPGSPKRPWRITVIALSVCSAFYMSYLGIAAGLRFADFDRRLSEANQRAWDAQRKAKTFELSSESLRRITDTARAVGPAVGDVQLNCTPGEENDRISNALKGALQEAGWNLTLTIGATLWGGTNSPAVVAASDDQRARGDALAEALRREGIRAESRPIDPKPSNPKFIIAIMHP